VSSAKAADLRRFLHRHAKSNGIDAETLARIPLADPAGLQHPGLPGADAAALDRRVRACDRLTSAGSEHKVRTGDLVRQLLPVTPLTGDLGQAGLAVLERYAGPRVLLAAGPAGLIRLITSASGHQQGKERALQWRAAAAAALGLYGDHPAVSLEELAAEVATEVRLLHAIQAELAAHAAAREQHYRRVDPGQLARPCPGSPRSAHPPSSPSWAAQAGSATQPGSSPTRASRPGQARPGRPTARASR
jgi:hypothetical protein